MRPRSEIRGRTYIKSRDFGNVLELSRHLIVHLLRRKPITPTADSHFGKAAAIPSEFVQNRNLFSSFFCLVSVPQQKPALIRRLCGAFWKSTDPKRPQEEQRTGGLVANASLQHPKFQPRNLVGNLNHPLPLWEEVSS